MNFYKRHLGDIAKACAHLSQGAMGAYDLLLDWLYGNERPLPTDKKSLYRIGRAETKAERDNVDRVIVEFFQLTEAGYSQKRATAEMAKANAQAETNRQIAEAREARRRQARMVHESCNETSDESCTNGQPSQTPDSRLQKDQEQKTLQPAAGVSPTEKTVEDPPPPADGEKPPKAEPVPVAKIVALYHELLPTLPKVALLTDTRASHIRARWRKQLNTLDQWRNYFATVAASNFLMGRTTPAPGRRLFVADIDYLINESNLAKIAEGKFHD